MSTSSSSTYDALLKNVYGPGIAAELNTNHPILDNLEDLDTLSEGGRQFIWAVQYDRNKSFRGVSESGTLPTAGASTNVNGIATTVTLAGRIELTKQVMDKSKKGDKSAFAAAMKREMSVLKESAMNDFHRQLWGTDISGITTTGVLTQVNGGSGPATTITVDDVSRLETGMPLAIGTAAELGGTGTPAYGTITAINTTTKVVTLDGNVTVVDNDLVVLGESTGNSYGNEIYGLDYIVNDADDNLFSIDTGNYPRWKSTVLDNSGVGRDLTLDLMQQLIDDVARTSGEEGGDLWMSTATRREYIALLLPDVRFQAQQLKGGFSQLTFSGGTSKPTPLYVDWKCPNGKIFYINKSYLKKYVDYDWGFMDEDGRVLRNVANKANFEATFITERNMVTTRRTVHGKLTDINVTLTASGA